MTSDEAIDHLAVLAERMNDKGRMIYVGDIALEAVDMAIEALEKLKTGEWNVITKRPMDAEEREFWEVEMGEISDEDAYIYENLPEEGEEVLVCTQSGRVFIDTMCKDEGCYFEEMGDLEDVAAWMPLPEPYKEVCE